ncbi:MAG TPA: glycoside hydrolase family 3 N-terminal domain-containing protein [Gemmatimonadaceae bacterium]|nr:glycoside hydrolase family 3 N-terminal domain-containing protein [Gemmatimonadaceae bacterium]
MTSIRPLRRSAAALAVVATAAAACAAPQRPAPATTPTATPTTSPTADRRPPTGIVRAPGEDRFVDSVLATMTLAEKLGQLNQLSGMGAPTGPGGTPAGIERIRRGEVGSFLNVVGADTTRALQKIAIEQSPRRIPLLFGLDVIHGFRTEFPVPLGEASSWDPALVEKSARVAATEAAAHGVNWTFAPMVDVARDPRWGRIVEGSGEDPYLGSVMAMARVRGFQGSDLRASDAVAATAKHFAAYGAAEGGRDYNVADISERTLRDVYLPPFHAAVCAGVETLMAAFDEIGGVPSHANRKLTTDILRGEWGFDGMVVSDWTGVGELLNHGIGADSGTVAARAIDAGVDMDMVTEAYLPYLPAMVRQGRVSQATVDEATRRVLRLKYRLGLFQDPYHGADAARARAVTLTAENRAAARALARESIVLLKNAGGVLPLRKDLGTVAVIGALAADRGAALGNWTGMGRSEDAVSVLDGIRRAVSPRTKVLYAAGASPESNDTTGIAEAVRTARRANAVVLVVGETPGMSAEASSRASIDLPGAQRQLARALRATGVPVVAVLMNGRPLAIQWMQDSIPAIVETWFAGIETGNATADVLFGDYNPGGKLTVTFPRLTGQVPIYYAHKNTGRPPADSNHYSSKYIDAPFTPLYAFGHGLSYTTFSYGALRLSAPTMRAGDTLRVSVDVTNSGRRAGDEVVQLYVRDSVGSVTRPVKELRGFRRLHLEPGETKAVTFTLDANDLAFHDSAMARVVEPGAFTVWVGTSSTDDGRPAHFQLTTADGRSVAVPERCEARRE